MKFNTFIFSIFYVIAMPLVAQPTILVLGDSLSAGYGIPHDKQWVELLKHKLVDEDFSYLVVNASQSGMTSRQGLRKLPKLLSKYKPTIVIIGLGSNDGLRGQPIMRLKQNLQEMIQLSLEANSEVIFIGFHLPQNYGKRYAQQYRGVFTELASDHDVSFVSFLLAGFATDLGYFQKDKLHPTAQAQPLMLNNVWPTLEGILNELD